MLNQNTSERTNRLPEEPFSFEGSGEFKWNETCVGPAVNTDLMVLANGKASWFWEVLKLRSLNFAYTFSSTFELVVAAVNVWVESAPVGGESCRTILSSQLRFFLFLYFFYFAFVPHLVWFNVANLLFCPCSLGCQRFISFFLETVLSWTHCHFQRYQLYYLVLGEVKEMFMSDTLFLFYSYRWCLCSVKTVSHPSQFSPFFLFFVLSQLILVLTFFNESSE